MCTKSVVLFLTLVFFFGSIEYNVVDAAGSESNHQSYTTLWIMFLSQDETSATFFKNQLAPAYEELSQCEGLRWNFHPLYSPLRQRDVDNLYQCIHFYNKAQHQYKLGKFYNCMMNGGEQFTQGLSCAKSAGLNWLQIKDCQMNSLGLQPEYYYHLEIEFNANNVNLPNALTDLKGTVCAELKRIQKPCASCPP